MSFFTDYLDDFVDLVIANPSITRGEAVDDLQLRTNGVSNADGNAFFDEVATFLNSIGSVGNSTFSSMRNAIGNKGATACKALFAAVERSIKDGVAAAPIWTALRNFDQENQVAQLTSEIDVIVTYRDALLTPPPVPSAADAGVLTKALNAGRSALVDKRTALQERIARRTS